MSANPADNRLPPPGFNRENRPYQHTVPEINQWEIYRLSEDRQAFIRKLEQASKERILQESGDNLTDVLSKTVFSEQERTRSEPWKVDPPNERRYWKRQAKLLATQSLDEDEPATAEEAAQAILDRIVHRYAEEIVGTFKIPTFRFARRFLTFFFGRLLNAAGGRSFTSLFSKKILLQEKLLVRGYVDQVRELSKKGTVIMVPTHFSNLDSILIGYALDQVAGLEAMAFGAGLNLYNTGYTAYFMNRLGAYRVDRRKRNPIYMTTLKIMSKLIIQRGVPSLFFPGGTRSRSGALETKLKLGLLGTAVEAQRARYQAGRDDKVYIVPVILSYPFVLEAQFLIEQHLRREGQDRYIKAKDSFHSLRSILKFIWGVFSKGNEITISLGQPMDVVGNRVSEDGKSYALSGRHVSTREYFRDQYGKINEDLQRENEYTRLLASRIVERYHSDGIVLPSHLISYAAFAILERSFPKDDLYALLRLPAEDFYFQPKALESVVEQLRDILLKMELEDRVKVSDEIRNTAAKIIDLGLESIGNYHIHKPLRCDSRGHVVSDNFSMLHYYHNRLSTYKLKNKVKFPQNLIGDERKE
ncbi:1-acyl-sn-glycerol-3-phosphate acyltransferase [Lewinella sp. IMCC34191]|uniref:1-acyl-sn-glycerol-3-phosphate acyltransferase n=1 Tax=Lewinella sp. IMCC34191 TaxID=2259172 RepID=UPI000E24DB0B|nr:1-acyl-sn-glycerol-3-phosphate acyltransferase [Lewinella sp. IMCC34191]